MDRAPGQMKGTLLPLPGSQVYGPPGNALPFPGGSFQPALLSTASSQRASQGYALTYVTGSSAGSPEVPADTLRQERGPK